jgi:hypothetical protein
LTLMRHEIGGQLADRDAIHHQAEMLRPDMIAAHFETLGHRGSQANRMAAQALFNAMTGFLGELIHCENLWARLRRNARPAISVPLTPISLSCALGRSILFR